MPLLDETRVGEGFVRHSQRALDQALRFAHGALRERAIAVVGQNRELQVRVAALAAALALANDAVLVLVERELELHLHFGGAGMDQLVD